MAAVTKNSPNLKKSSSKELLYRFIPNFIFKVLDGRSTKFVQIKPLGALKWLSYRGDNLEHVLTYGILQKSSSPEPVNRFQPNFIVRVLDWRCTKFVQMKPQWVSMAPLQWRELCTCANM